MTSVAEPGRASAALPHAWTAMLAVGAGAAGIFLLSPAREAGQAVAFCGIGIAATLAVVSGVVRHRPVRRFAWLLLAAGLAAYSIGNVGVFRVPESFPSWVDGAFLTAYLLILSGIGLLIRPARRGGQRTSLLDSAVVTLGIGVVPWLLLIEPNLLTSELALDGRVVAAAYPLISIAMMCLLARLLFTSALRTPALGLLGAAIVCSLAADLPYAFERLNGTFSIGAPYSVGWMLMLTLVGAAALHPSMAGASGRLREDPAGSRWQLGVLGAAAMVAPISIVVASIGDVARHNLAVLGVVSAGLFVLVFLRMAGLLDEIARRRRIDRMKDEFTSVVSHELRTPLTSIRGALGLLAGGVLTSSPEKAQRMIEIALTSTDRLVRLINDILDIDRMESGRATLQARECDLSALATQTAEQMRAMAAGAGVRIVVEATALRAEVDSDRILQTLTNLTSNAIKFSPPGTTVTIGVAPAGSGAVVSVADEGRGIPPDKLEAVFERFQQVDGSDSREKGGTGLGLAICRSIVNQHGGRIWVESTLGRGSVFSFSLPHVTAPDAAPEAADASSGAPSSGDTVLVCDDDDDLRAWLTGLLEAEGYDVVGARSGEAAVDEARARRPGVIVLDLVMRGMGGWETAEALARDPVTRGIPIVVMSALAPDRTEAPTGRIVDWLTKPSSGPAVIRSVARARATAPAGARVLVVEDDEELAGVLCTSLESRGLTTRHCRSGAEVIGAADEFDPDAVVLDLLLPDGDGRTVLESLRAYEGIRRVPVLIYTALDEDDVGERIDGEDVAVLSKGRVSPATVGERVVRLIQDVTAGGMRR